MYKTMAELPAARSEVEIAIKKLIKEKGFETLTSKNIREHLSTVFGKDFTELGFKKEIDDITRTKIEEVQKEKNNSNGNGASNKKDDSASSSDENDEEDETIPRGGRKLPADESDSDSSVDNEDEKPKAKRPRKPAGSDADSDFDLATGVKMRRSGTKKTPKPKKDSKPKAKNESGYMKKCVVSDEIFHLFGKRFMARSEVVKEMWAYIKSNNLHDPKNKQFIRPDEMLHPIFKCTKFRGFGMMKHLKNHIHDPKHIDKATLEQYEREYKASGSKSDSDEKDEESEGEKEEKPQTSNKKSEETSSDEGTASESD